MATAGVYDALKQKYLKCLLFGISEDERGSCLMEVSSTAAQSDQSSHLMQQYLLHPHIAVVLILQQCPMQQSMQYVCMVPLHVCTVSSSFLQSVVVSVSINVLVIDQAMSACSLKGTHTHTVQMFVVAHLTIVRLQEYVYKFNYENDGGVTVDVSTNGKSMAKGNKKKQVCQPSTSCLYHPLVS